MGMKPKLLIIPGLRDHVADHWQTLLHESAAASQIVWPLGDDKLDCSARVATLEHAAWSAPGPIVIVAHSGGVPVVAHWARHTKRHGIAALLATPPDIERPLPPGYPTISQLEDGGWLPLPRKPLPFRCIVAASRNDPLATFDRVAAMAHDWGAQLEDLGNVGHLNPASGYGPWPYAEHLIGRLSESMLAR